MTQLTKHNPNKIKKRRCILYRILIVPLFLLIASSLNAQITIRKKAAPLEEVLGEIRKQTDYQFLYDNDVKKIFKEITINMENVSIETFLNKCIGTNPVSYTITNKTILLKIRKNDSTLVETVASNNGQEIRGKIIDMQGKPLSMASIRVSPTEVTITSQEDGSFSISRTEKTGEITISVSYVGKVSVNKTIPANQLGTFQLISLNDLNLKLAEVEVNGIRKKTSASNSSLIFDKQAIEQAQAMSVGDVLRQMPGQTMVRPGASLQGSSTIMLRSAIPNINSEHLMNNSFGINMQIDGNSLNNNGNMQMMNPSRNGLISANMSPPNTLGDLSQKNGSFNSDYKGDVANSGIDLRQIQSENIESIEVVTGVASARYGDYSTGMILVKRQAGITPLRMNFRANEGTVNAGINTGFAVSPSLGVMNLSLDYLNSNDDPRNKLKSFNRAGGGLLWTFFHKKSKQFKNTLSIDYTTTFDRTKRDPDDGNDRMVKFNDKNIRLSNRSELIVKKPWLYNIQLQLSYNRQRQESYSQYYLNNNVIGIADAIETKTYEGYYVQGYYTAVQHVIGEPVSASGRLETTSFFKTKNISYKLLLGVTRDYNANKGPGTLIFDDRPRFHQSGNKNDRARSFNLVPTMESTAFYTENSISTRLLKKYFTINAGLRGDIQNKYFTLSPRVNASWKLNEKITWNLSYGIATKAPGLAQISPGNVYIDIPLIRHWTGNADSSLYLVHTKVIPNNYNHLKPYKSNTWETGFNIDAKPFHASVYYFYRIQDNSFASYAAIDPVVLPNYDTIHTDGPKPAYEPNGTYKTWSVGYNKIINGNYSRTNGLEVMIGTDKIKVLSTSFNINTAMYWSEYYKNFDEIYVPDHNKVDDSKTAMYGVYSNAHSKATNIKSTITTNTHIPSLRMVVMFTGELFWVNLTETMASGMYPTGYYTRDITYFPLSEKEVELPEFAHLIRTSSLDRITHRPSFFYPNIHLRMSKEIGDFLRFSFNAYNVFNIRPDGKNSTGAIQYYNGRSAYGIELIFTIK